MAHPGQERPQCATESACDKNAVDERDHAELFKPHREPSSPQLAKTDLGYAARNDQAPQKKDCYYHHDLTSLSVSLRPYWHRSRSYFLVAVGIACFLLAALNHSWSSSHASGCPSLISLILPQCGEPVASLSTLTPTPNPVLDVFEVHEPVLVPLSKHGEDGHGSDSCTVVLVRHSFGFSYGRPFVGEYTPPPCSFNRVVVNLTVTSRGRQFDRLALLYFNDTEVFRTSTAEPTVNGIVWSYRKDLSEYLYLWNQPEKIIFDLGNLVDDTYTGFFNTTLTATFFTIPDDDNDNDTVSTSFTPASLTLPVSAHGSASNQGSVFRLPSTRASTTLRLPRNANRAVFTIAACGQAAEEFWWSNVLQSETRTFLPTQGELPGFSPFREVQLYIDGSLAGVVWPFPVIFTGGVVPSLWRPIVGLQAFDLREHEIDISPFLPILSDGQPHTFEIKVAGLDDGGKGKAPRLTETVGNEWLVTGKIFLWLADPDENNDQADGEETSAITTGTPPVLHVPAPQFSIHQKFTQNETTGINETLKYTVRVARSLSISSSLRAAHSTALIPVTWEQDLMYSVTSTFTAEGAIQDVSFLSGGVDIAETIAFLPSTQDTSNDDDNISQTKKPTQTYKHTYSSPLNVNTSTLFDRPSRNLTIVAALDRSLTLSTEGPSVFPSGLDSLTILDLTSSSQPLKTLPNPKNLSGTYTHTVLNASGWYFGSPQHKISFGSGETSQVFEWGGLLSSSASVQDERAADVPIYQRAVEARQGSVRRDREVFGGQVWRDFAKESGNAEENVTMPISTDDVCICVKKALEEDMKMESGPSRIGGLRFDVY